MAKKMIEIENDCHFKNSMYLQRTACLLFFNELFFELYIRTKYNADNDEKAMLKCYNTFVLYSV